MISISKVTESLSLAVLTVLTAQLPYTCVLESSRNPDSLNQRSYICNDSYLKTPHLGSFECQAACCLKFPGNEKKYNSLCTVSSKIWYPVWSVLNCPYWYQHFNRIMVVDPYPPLLEQRGCLCRLGWSWETRPRRWYPARLQPKAEPWPGWAARINYKKIEV